MNTHANPTAGAVDTPAGRLAAALASPNSSARMRAAMTAGTSADPSFLDPLVERCAIEEDFSVRETLTWALTRLPVDLVLPRIIAELGSPSPTARSQALHTISKLGDERAWPAIGPELLHSEDDGVARTAWRAAVAVAPEHERQALATELVAELGRGGSTAGRGDTELWRSLSRAIAALGDAAAAPLAAAATAAALSGDVARSAHAAATEQLLADPDAGFALAPEDARRLGTAHSGTPRAH